MQLDCGIRRDRLTTWLDGEIALPRHNDGWVFAHEGLSCTIALTPLENRVLGKLDLERTLVTIEGDDVAIEEFYRLFTLRFISAGG